MNCFFLPDVCTVAINEAEVFLLRMPSAFFQRLGSGKFILVYEKSQVQLCHTCYFLEDGKGDGF